MPKPRLSTSLKKSIIGLQAIVDVTLPKKGFSLDDIEQATLEAQRVFAAVKALAEVKANKELTNFIRQVMNVNHKLHKMAKQKLPIPSEPNMLLHNVSSSCSRLIDALVSPAVYRNISRVASFSPWIGETVVCITTLPSRWNNGSSRQRLALALGATLILSCLAFTISLWAVPGLATVPFIGVAITCLSALAGGVYTTTVSAIDEKKKQRASLEKSIVALDAQDKALKDLLKICPREINPDPKRLKFFSIRKKTLLLSRMPGFRRSNSRTLKRRILGSKR